MDEVEPAEDRMENYVRIAVVGRGAYGVCWLCRRKESQHREKVILKTIPLHGLSNEEEIAIMGEVMLLKKMRHPMIIGYYSYFKYDNTLAIVMQYAEGGTMERMIQEQRGEHFHESSVLDFFTQILIALHHMHSKSIVHRDLKTQNILMNKKRTLVKLSDFGISKELSTKSVASTVIGTPNYLSPEICEGRAYNQKSDVWSLGCVLYELLALRRAFDGDNLPSIVMKITKCSYSPIGDHATQEVRELVGNLLRLNEHQRPNVQELLTHPLVLPYTLRIHCDVGRVIVPENNKRRANSVMGGRLRITPSAQSLRPQERFPTKTPISLSNTLR
ncbi:unnamed protein product, partial [Mesorhabditis belari]|uniref:non-specific serine/threonine protein kinase n=1 Tax=Mesorhabditis belari TaxID=2138241 RepID=A0AAF3J2X7_9BILA